MSTLFIFKDKTIFRVHCTVSGIETFKNQSTSFPLENGSIISDHIIIQPFELSITGKISTIEILRSDKNIKGEAKDFLIKIKRVMVNKELVTIQYLNRTYKNMSIESFVLPKDKPNSVLDFSMTLKQLKFVNNKTEKIKPTNKDKKLVNQVKSQNTKSSIVNPKKTASYNKFKKKKINVSFIPSVDAEALKKQVSKFSHPFFSLVSCVVHQVYYCQYM